MVDSRQVLVFDVFLFGVLSEFFQNFMVPKIFQATLWSVFDNLIDELFFFFCFSLLKLTDQGKYIFNNFPELCWGKGQATQFLFDNLGYDKVLQDIRWQFADSRHRYGHRGFIKIERNSMFLGGEGGQVGNTNLLFFGAASCNRMNDRQRLIVWIPATHFSCNIW